MKIYPFLLVLIFTLNAFAGESIFGINDYSLGIMNIPYSNAGVGRSYEIGNRDSLRLNFFNYSLWTEINNPTYGIKLGYRAAFSKDNIRSDYFNDYANFEGGYLAIPVLKKKLVIGLGLQPFSNIEQRIQTDEGDVHKFVLIRGGISKGTLNVSYAVNKRLRIGLGYEYNFGEILRSFRIELEGSDYPLSFDYQYRYYGNGAVISAYGNPVKNLGMGIVYRPSYTLKTRIKPQTTSDYINDSRLKKITIPSFLGFGLRYNLNSRTSVGSDLIYQNWAKGYKVEGKSFENLFSDYVRLGVGFERRQSHKLFTSFAEKLDYRFGLFYGKQNYLSLGNDVKEYGMSLGLSLPITRFRSRIDFSLILGKRGNLSKNQYEEKFLMFGVTINASEIWFVKLED
ncbi:MAG: hypothetical protein GXO77_07695 [Calditrichaeota bacterium]|nr:hypothetical protein [Calditrichota bacterium]